MKIKKFKNTDKETDFIRQEILRNGKKTKRVVFKIDVIQIKFLGQEENPDAESDEIIEKEKNDFNEENVVYRWENNIGFEK